MTDATPHMPAAGPTREKPLPASTPRRTAWRIISLAVILLGFVGPWMSSCSGTSTFNGFQITLLTAGSVPAVARGDTDPIYLVAFVGLACLLAYCAVSLFRTIANGTNLVWNKLSLGLLAVGAIGMSVGFRFELADFLWGYWTTWIGLGAALGCELSGLRSR